MLPIFTNIRVAILKTKKYMIENLLNYLAESSLKSNKKRAEKMVQVIFQEKSFFQLNQAFFWHQKTKSKRLNQVFKDDQFLKNIKFNNDKFKIKLDHHYVVNLKIYFTHYVTK